jgi:hypothetical protein
LPERLQKEGSFFPFSCYLYAPYIVCFSLWKTFCFYVLNNVEEGGQGEGSHDVLLY